MAVNATVTLQKAGGAKGTATEVELPAEVNTALADHDPTRILVETPIGSGKKYLLNQVA